MDKTKITLSNRSLQYLYFVLCKTTTSVLQEDYQDPGDFNQFDCDIDTLAKFFEIVEPIVIEFESEKGEIVKKARIINERMQAEERKPDEARDDKLIKKSKKELEGIDEKIKKLSKKTASFNHDDEIVSEIAELFKKTIVRPYKVQNGNLGLSTSEEVMMVSDILKQIDL